MNTATNLPPLKTLEEIEEEARLMAVQQVGADAPDIQMVQLRIELTLINQYYPKDDE